MFLAWSEAKAQMSEDGCRGYACRGRRFRVQLEARATVFGRVGGVRPRQLDHVATSLQPASEVARLVPGERQQPEGIARN